MFKSNENTKNIMSGMGKTQKIVSNQLPANFNSVDNFQLQLTCECQGIMTFSLTYNISCPT